jgi:hypothetical protein
MEGGEREAREARTGWLAVDEKRGSAENVVVRSKDLYPYIDYFDFKICTGGYLHCKVLFQTESSLSIYNRSHEFTLSVGTR